MMVLEKTGEELQTLDRINKNNEIDIVIQRLIERKRILAQEAQDISTAIRTLQLQKHHL